MHSLEDSLQYIKATCFTLYVLYALYIDITDSPHGQQIYIESVFPTVGDGGDMDVATAPLTDSEPLLLLYTSVRRRRQAKHELDLMISHEYDDDDELGVR